MEKQNISWFMLTLWMQPGQKNQQSCRAFSNIQFHWILQLNALFHTAKERSGWCVNFVSNSSSVIVSRSKIIMSLYSQIQQAHCIVHMYRGRYQKIYCLILFQLYLGALTCRTDISFKNIFKDFFWQLLHYKILSKNTLNKSSSIETQHK